MTDETQEHAFESIERLKADLRKAAATLSGQEVRFLVDNYYIIQEARKRSNNQILAMEKEPHDIIRWFASQNEMLEQQIKGALDRYTKSKPIGQWLQATYGVGPVIAAGLMAHIDISKCPTVGHIWSFAGLDPTQEWKKGQKRPWNARLKTLCWRIGQSFMKFSNRDDCYYGKVYKKRKEFEIERNEAHEKQECNHFKPVEGRLSPCNFDLAKELLPKYNKSTEAYKHLATGKLPPAQIDARARRYAVKLFLSHMQQVWWKLETGEDPPKPYAITVLGHGHYLEPPH